MRDSIGYAPVFPVPKPPAFVNALPCSSTELGTSTTGRPWTQYGGGAQEAWETDVQIAWNGSTAVDCRSADDATPSLGYRRLDQDYHLA